MPLEEVKRNIIGGKVKRISSSVQLALTRGYSAEEIINAMTESMLQVGALFHTCRNVSCITSSAAKLSRRMDRAKQ